MLSTIRLSLLALVAPALMLSAAACVQPKSVEHSKEPTGNTLNGLAADWQVRAAGYLEKRAAGWLVSPPPISNVKCAMSCHTTFPYLMARSTLAPFAITPAADQTRAVFEARVDEAVAGTAIAFYGKNNDDRVVQSLATEAVLNAAALALDDTGAGKPLTTKSKSALELMWSKQRPEGTWAWLEFGLEPWETRNDFGAALAALVVGSIPPGSTETQAAGTTKLVGYVQARLPSMVLHDRAMVLYASGKLTTLLNAGQADAIASALAATQLPDGGFSLGAWGQGAQATQVAQTSDGYATSLAVLALCTGIPGGTKSPFVVQGLHWLAQNQADDGSWPGQSVNDTTAQTKAFMTDAATAYAAIAITRCSLGK